MKIGFGKRVLMFLHWLFSLLICVVLALSILVPNVFETIKASLVGILGAYGRLGCIIIGAVAAAIYVFLCLAQAGIIFSRRTPRSERGFITIDSNDNSRVRIAISAIEQMVRQSVYNIDGISDMKIGIASADDAIEININASILAGSHVPTITMNMQQAIRKFVEINCGVAVRTVAVSINSVTSAEASTRKKHKNHKGAQKVEGIVPVPAFVGVNEAHEEETEAEAVIMNEAVEPVHKPAEPEVSEPVVDPVSIVMPADAESEPTETEEEIIIDDEVFIDDETCEPTSMEDVPDPENTDKQD